MTHAKGTRLDGIVDLNDLRERCVIDEDTGCWHLRTGHGKQLPEGKRYMLWLYGVGSVTATRGAWMLKNPGKQLRNGWIAFRTCRSYDCVSHITAANRATWSRHMAASGKAATAARVAACLSMPRYWQKLTPELKRWLLESPQSGPEAAHALGITQSRANAIRSAHRKATAERPPCSVFDFAMRAAA